MKYFKKVLIANRGEIARRIIRTCKKLNISTVAVYSDADRDAPFVKEADEAIHIGESQPKKSYLDMEKIMGAAKEAKADAVHPGYGFLSENPHFVRRCKEEGITFIGPSEEVIRLMGSKLESRLQMEKAGVPIIPGSTDLHTLEDARKEANAIGYPLMLKASAGGGGIGMKIIQNEDELEKAFESTKKQASSFFNDGTVYVEKFIAHPRHIEVQVAADIHGNSIHLFERDCSIQRRHQKVIEESPSPFLDDETREKLFHAALVGVKGIGYTNVGTMEFIVDENKNFYFLEMNTRLQVEHPVTEEITGIDLVEWQFHLAAGGKIPLKQEQIKKRGHAIECRIYAEDPITFFPSPGKITQLTLPNNKTTRLEIGVEEGANVTPFYDPMIGKLIVHGENRKQAINKMVQAIAAMKVEGIKTNLPLLQEIMMSDSYISGDVTTHFLQQLRQE